MKNSNKMAEKIMCCELSRTANTSEWIKALESELIKQRKELAGLKYWAKENKGFLPVCKYMRRKMEETKLRLAECYYLRERLN